MVIAIRLSLRGKGYGMRLDFQSGGHWMMAWEAYHGLFLEWSDSCYCFVCLSWRKECLLLFELSLGFFSGIAVAVVGLANRSIGLITDSRTP